MPPQPNARHSNADGGKGRADHPDTRNEYGAQPRPTTRKSQGLNSTQTGFKPETSIATPVFQAGLATRLQSRCYLSEYVKKQLIHKHEKPIRDKHDEDVKALGEGSTGAHPGHDGIPDRNSLEETARAGLQAGLKAVQPAIATELKALDDLITSEYQPLIRMYMINDVKNRLATLKRDKESRARGQPVMFTRAEVAEAEEVWKAKRISLGLPLEGNLDDLDPGEMVREQSEGMI